MYNKPGAITAIFGRQADWMEMKKMRSDEGNEPLSERIFIHVVPKLPLNTRENIHIIM